MTVYRGCSKVVLTGASWSLEKEVAASVPFLNRYRVLDPVVVTARVKKANILALKMDREEAEVITFSARRTKVERDSKS